MVTLLSFKDIEKKIKAKVWPFIIIECKRHKVEVPLYGFENVDAPFKPRGLYHHNPPKITVNYFSYKEYISVIKEDERITKLTGVIPFIKLTEEKCEFNMIETVFHELKHHIDVVHHDMEAQYADNVLKWEGRATKYAAKMMIKYKFRDK